MMAWVRKRDPDEPVPIPKGPWDNFQVPCGQWFPGEVEASWHYLRCDPCSEAHKARRFRAPGTTDPR